MPVGVSLHQFPIVVVVGQGLHMLQLSCFDSSFYIALIDCELNDVKESHWMFSNVCVVVLY